MSALTRLIAITLLALAAPLAAIEPLEYDSPEQELRYQQLLRELRCLQCQNQSLADSDANVASGLRQLIHKQMRSGKSDEEIKAFLVERYGEFVLYRPRVESGTWLLWFGPFAILAAGGIALTLHLRKRRRSVPAAAPTAPRDEEDW